MFCSTGVFLSYMIGMIEVEVRHYPNCFWYSSVEYCTTQDETMSAAVVMVERGSMV